MNKWTIETVTKESQKFNSVSEWRKGSFTSYVTACQFGIYKDLIKDMKKNKKWTKEAVIEEAKRFSSKVEWRRKSSGSYDAAITNKWTEEASPHMSRPINKNAKWTKEKIFIESKKFNSRMEWNRKSKGSYRAAQRLGILDLIDLPNLGGKSLMEKDLLKSIRKIYPSARSKNVKNKDKKIPLKWIEIDIYIPELNKGIEFDGTYYHSFEGLKKSRPHLSDEILLNYHSIKDNIANDCGISILHIREKDWLQNKEKCVNLCLNFLGAC
jgi:stalled ribosome alternative rescue factor ArfA